jgi:hypothetical protein
VGLRCLYSKKGRALLVLFFCAVVDHHLVIVFTEHSGAEDVVQLIKSIPGLLYRQQNQE